MKAADTSVVGIDPNAANLRDDPRYASLFPTPEEFADPFVEDVVVLQEWRGEAAGDQFGWIARNIGDVDGDGIADATMSAPTAQVDGQPAGKVYVYSSGTGELLWSVTGPPVWVMANRQAAAVSLASAGRKTVSRGMARRAAACSTDS